MVNNEILLQNAMPSPYCRYSSVGQGDKSGCFLYYANEWLTFQIHIKIGTWYLNDSNYHRDSVIEMWIAREGQSSTLVFSFTDYDLANNNPLAKYGKIWFLPYMTSKDETQSHPTAYTWYDDLIISRNQIPDPIGGMPPAAPAGLRIVK